MRRIAPIFATLIVASWLFMIGFAVGFESELASRPALTREHPDAALAGLTAGAMTVVVALVITACVLLARAAIRAQRSRGTRIAQ